jgi:hypothetical protein
VGNSGSLAMFVAMRRASSRVRSLAAARHPGSSSKLEIGERLAVPSRSSEALQIQLGVGVIDDQGGGGEKAGDGRRGATVNELGTSAAWLGLTRAEADAARRPSSRPRCPGARRAVGDSRGRVIGLL